MRERKIYHEKLSEQAIEDFEQVRVNLRGKSHLPLLAWKRIIIKLPAAYPFVGSILSAERRFGAFKESTVRALYSWMTFLRVTVTGR